MNRTPVHINSFTRNHESLRLKLLKRGAQPPRYSTPICARDLSREDSKGTEQARKGFPFWERLCLFNLGYF